LDLEVGLADEILRDAGGDSGALPLVAFCLYELFRQNKDEYRFSLDAYRALGGPSCSGLRGAINLRADALLEEFQSTEDADIEALLPVLFRALVHVNAGGTATRQPALRDELMAEPHPMPKVVQALIDARLLLAEDVGGQAVVTLAHEALIQEWTTLFAWLDHSRAQLQRLQLHLLHLRGVNPTIDNMLPEHWG
jgi:hypothetical protein